VSQAALLAALAAGGVVAAVADLAVALAGLARRVRSARPPRGGDGATRLVRAAGMAIARLGVVPQSGLAARLAAAGVARPSAPAELMAAKLGLAGVALVLVLPRLAGGAGLLVTAAPIAAYLAPDALIARRAARRAGELSAEVPDLLDRMRLAAEAGLGPERALAAAAAHADGLLAREVRAVLAARALGASSEAALARLAERCPVAEVSGLVAALRRSASQGAPIAPALEALARSARAERTRALDERAQRAAPKIQLVVALLLVPAALLLVGAGLVATLAP